MAHVMIKRGSLDNSVTFEHFCDTTADLQNIPAEQITFGSVAVVLPSDDNALEIYIANSSKEWILVLGSSNVEEEVDDVES